MTFECNCGEDPTTQTEDIALTNMCCRQTNKWPPDSHLGLEPCQNLISLSTLVTKHMCKVWLKSVKPFSRNRADKLCNAQTDGQPENIMPPPQVGGGIINVNIKREHALLPQSSFSTCDKKNI